MSTTTISIDPKTTLLDSVRRIGGMYANDLSFVPSDKVAGCPMGSARSPLDFTAEVAGFNYYVASTLKGNSAKTPEEREAFQKSIDSLEKARQALDSSVETLADAISSLDEEGLTREVSTPWGDTVSAYRLANMCVMHMMYHDGQINYIQTLYGDCENHWT